MSATEVISPNLSERLVSALELFGLYLGYRPGLYDASAGGA